MKKGKKTVKIWDFDGVIFNNPNNVFTDMYLYEILNTNNGVHPELFTKIPKTGINILFTGRSQLQRDLILKLCQLNGLKFDETVFSSFESHDYALNNFMDVYYDWKDSIMGTNFCVKYPDNQKILLDDDIKVIQHFQVKQFDVILMHVPVWQSCWSASDLTF